MNINPIKNSLPCKVRRAKESSLQVKGSKLFNLLPATLRNINGCDTNTFKLHLDTYLSQIPDQPTIPDRVRAAATNSLLDQIPMSEQQY